MEEKTKQCMERLEREIAELEALVAQTLQVPDTSDTRWARALFLYRIKQCQQKLDLLSWYKASISAARRTCETPPMESRDATMCAVARLPVKVRCS